MLNLAKKYINQKNKPANIISMKHKKSQGEEDTPIKINVDKVLDKLNTEGWENLTDSEQQVLYRASEMYSNRDHPN